MTDYIIIRIDRRERVCLSFHPETMANLQHLKIEDLQCRLRRKVHNNNNGLCEAFAVGSSKLRDCVILTLILSRPGRNFFIFSVLCYFICSPNMITSS